MTRSRSRNSQKGGTRNLAIDVSGISQFQPRFLRGLVLWCNAEESYVKRETIREYASRQPADVRTQLLDHFSEELETQVITQLRSNTPEAPNALVPFELESATTTTFPRLMHRTGGVPNAVLIAAPENYLQLITEQPLLLPETFTHMTISKDVELEYVKSLSSLLVKGSAPDAEFSELIVYNRVLEQPELQQLEGYLAYRRNEQWKLPATHPYFPELPNLPDDIGTILDDILVIRRQILVSDPSDLTKVPVKDGCIRRTHELESMVKQVVLYLTVQGTAPTRATVFQWIPKLFPEMAPVSEQAFRAEMQELLELVGLIEPGNAMRGGGPSAPPPAPPPAPPDPIQDAKNEEYLALSAVEAAGREFYRPLRQAREAITLHGERLVGQANQALRAELQTLSESMEILWSESMQADSALREKLEPLTAKFNSGEWTRDLREFDSTELPDSAPTARRYRDPFLQSIYDRWQGVFTELSRGDAAYCILRIARAMDSVKRLLAAFETNDVLFYHAKTYKTYCMQKFKELEQFHQAYQAAAPALKRAVEDLIVLLAKTVQIQRPPVEQTEPFRPQFTQLHHTQPITIRRVTADDTFITGIEWVETDSSGELSAAATDLRLCFPKWEDLSGGPTEFTTPTTFFNGSERVQQAYRCIQNSQDSILGVLQPDLLPEVISTHVDTLYEFPRLQWNAIHRLTVALGTEPVVLPKYGLTQGAYYVVRNDGAAPFCIQIPGSPGADLTLTLGPTEVMIFIVGPDPLAHDSYYGVFPLLKDLLPYDTILGTPRAHHCCWVPELSSFVYLLQADPPIPLLDASGRLIPVQKAADGFVYDWNDSLHCNPYVVHTIAEQPLAVLGHRTLRPAAMDAVRVRKERRSGLAILCDASGLPLFNEFGQTRAVYSPLLLVGTNLHMRTSDTDTIVIPTEGEIATPYAVESFLNFRTLFRSHFAVARVGGGFVFVSPTELPLCAPDGVLVQLPTLLTKVSETEYGYQEGGTAETVYLLSRGGMPSARELPPSREVPFVDTAAVLPALKALQDALMTLKRVQLTSQAFANILEFIKQQKTILTAFGEESTLKIIQFMDEISADIQTSADELVPMQELVEPLKLRLVSVPIPDDVKGSLQTLEVQLKTLTEKVQANMKLVEKNTAVTNGFVRRIGAVQKELEALRETGAAAFTASFQTVQAAVQQHLVQRQTSSVPELEEFLQDLAKTQERFRQRLNELDAGLAARPKDLTQVDAWIRGLEHLLVTARADVAHAKHSVGEPLFTTLKRLDTEGRERLRQRVKEQLAAIQAFAKPLEPLRVWYGLEQAPATIPSAWGSVFPLFRNGIAASVADWAPILATVPESPARAALQTTLQRGETLKKSLQEFLTLDPFKGYDDLKRIHVDASNISIAELKHYLGTLELRVTDLTANVGSVESVNRAFMEELLALEPALRKAYQDGPIAELKQLADTLEALETRRIAVETVARTLPGSETAPPPTLPASVEPNLSAVQTALASVAQPDAPLSRFAAAAHVAETQREAVRTATKQLEEAAAHIQTHDAAALKELEAKWGPLLADIKHHAAALQAKPLESLSPSTQLYIRQTIPATLAKLESAPRSRYGEFLDTVRAAETFHRNLLAQSRAAATS